MEMEMEVEMAWLAPERVMQGSTTEMVMVMALEMAWLTTDEVVAMEMGMEVGMALEMAWLTKEKVMAMETAPGLNHRDGDGYNGLCLCASGRW